MSNFADGTKSALFSSLIPPAEDRLLTPLEASKYLGLRPETLKEYRRADSRIVGPKFVRLNDRVVRYRLSDLILFVTQREVAR